ncbi:unnamed protein product [Soboliphyme baturini]|uniref:Secreted protein n=1 Tax=Soboliphyme baturini TaxID=241478 RepID=A0A183IH22_9BILA|nr:unnamed protein product [Soboliphyme baturini]
MAHHLVFRLLYGLFCGVTIFVTYGRQSLCPVARVADCFNNLLPVITSSYKDKCHLYSQFRACFTHDGCTDRQSATIGSQVMFEMTGVRLPKEFLIAFLGNWRRACGGCLILDSPCSAAMKNYDLEHDSVFFDRLQKIVLVECSIHQCGQEDHVSVEFNKSLSVGKSTLILPTRP